jgi:8-oxo-dGTP diphosphatase
MRYDVTKNLPERTKQIASVNVLLLNNEKKYLFLRRANTGRADGHYTLPAGHLEKGESITSAAVRETKEETGVDISPMNLKLVHVMHRSDRDDDHERLDFFLVATEWEGKPTVAEPDKCDQIAWFAPEALPENTVEHIKLAMRAIANGAPLLNEVNW